MKQTLSSYKSKISRVLFGSKKLKTKTLENRPLWIDRQNCSNRLELISSPIIKQALTELRQDGIALIRSNVRPELCDQVVESFNLYSSSKKEFEKFKDPWGLFERLANLHLVSEEAGELLNNSAINSILNELFECKPQIVGSLYFDKGTGQNLHRDTPAFFTDPINNYVGVWTALEDVQTDSGPLMYIKGGHKVSDDYDLYMSNCDENIYFESVIKECNKLNLEVSQLCPSKGDTIIWHPQLPHGGSKITNPKISRKSIVGHYMSSNSMIYGPKEFFSEDKQLPIRSLKLVEVGELNAIDHGGPQFFRNRDEGNFDEF